jgi:TonB family protein
MALPEETNVAVDRKSRTIFAIRFSWRGKDWEIAMTTSEHPAFEKAMLPQAGPRWKFFSAGVVLQAVLLFAVFCLPLLFPDRIRDFRSYVAAVVSPSPDVVRAWKPEPLRRRPAPSKVVNDVPRSPAEHTVTAPVVSVPTLKTVQEIVPAQAPNVTTELPVALVPGIPAPPNLLKPRSPVQTGIFGEPDDVPSNGRPAKSRDIAQLGSYDSSGSSGHQSLGTLALGGGVVRQGLFSDELPLVNTRKSPTTAGTASQAKPVDILFKPIPKYTSEAMAKKIEGEVLVEVRFSVSGQITVLRVVRGLGYGLDESAEAAARQIRFKPAQNSEGLPVDSTAVVHIVFELAY